MGKVRIRVGNRRMEIDGVEVTASASEINTLASAVAGTGAASKGVVLDSSGNFAMPATGNFGLSRSAVAAAGSSQSGATALTAQINAVTGSDGAKGVALPAASTTAGPILIINTVQTVGSYLKVYPVNSGDDQINSLSANAAYSIAPGDGMWFVPTSATQWYTLDVGAGAIPGQTVLPSNFHTGGIPAQVSGDGNDTTPANTETYIAAVFVPASCTITGIRTFNGSVASGNIKLALADSTGAVVASTASTAMSGTDAYQQVAFSSPYAAKGPATYYVLQQIDNNTARVNFHAFGSFPASKKTGETYGTFTTITPPTTFTANQGPMATLY